MRLLDLVTTPLSWVRAIFFVLNTLIVCLVETLVLLPVYPFKLLFPQLYITFESFLYSKCGEAFVPVFTLLPQLRIYTDTMFDIEQVTRQRAMVMVNHQESGDVPVMMCLVANFNISHTTTWISDRMFKWTQFGIPAQWHNCFWSAEGNKAAVVKQLRDHFSTTYFDRGHKWIVFFPEGGYLRNRGESARRWAAKNDLPMLTHCCLPRATAFVNVHQAVRGDIIPVPDPVEEVVDVTIAYKGSRDLSLSDVVFGRFSHTEVYMNFRSYKVSEMPREEKELETWLYARYQEKDEMLARFKETGEFVEGNTFTHMALPRRRILGSLLFWYITAFFVLDFYRSLFGHVLALADRLI